MSDNDESGNNFNEEGSNLIIRLEKLNNRKLNSLVFFHNYHSIKNYNYEYKEKDSRVFIDWVMSKEGSYELEKSLDLMEEEYFIEDNYFEWLREDLRAQFFVLLFIRSVIRLEIEHINKINGKGVFGYLYPPKYSDIIIDNNGSIIEYIYELLDTYNLDNVFFKKNVKVRIVESARLFWSGLYSQCTYTQWVKSDDDYQLKWLKNYLENKAYYIDGVKGISSTEYLYSVILASLDYIDVEGSILKSEEYNETELKKQFIDRMKRSWNQKVHRDSGRSKKKYHLPLTVNTRNRLKKISMIEGASDSDILERLINEEYRSKYLDKNGQDKY